jgi:hypothetical protein
VLLTDVGQPLRLGLGAGRLGFRRTLAFRLAPVGGAGDRREFGSILRLGGGSSPAGEVAASGSGSVHAPWAPTASSVQDRPPASSAPVCAEARVRPRINAALRRGGGRLRAGRRGGCDWECRPR